MELEKDILHRILYTGAFAHRANWLVKTYLDLPRSPSLQLGQVQATLRSRVFVGGFEAPVPVSDAKSKPYNQNKSVAHFCQ
jgi:hypothetical protein